MAIELISNITPKNNGNFALVDAKDIQVDANGKRLDKKLEELENNIGSGSGTNIAVDNALSDTSTNPVQNSVITTALYDAIVVLKRDLNEIKEAINGSGEKPVFPTYYMHIEKTTDEFVKGLIYLWDGESLKPINGSIKIKTINNQSLLGEGNISISGGGSSIEVDEQLDTTSTNPVQNMVVATKFDAVDNSINSLWNNLVIEKVDLIAFPLPPSIAGYYQHTGNSNDEFTKGIIYYYNGTEFKPIDGSDGGGSSNETIEVDDTLLGG